jgi:two-component system sensor histidine kinase DesK
VLREATTNVLRHSAAVTVTITLDAADDCWTLEVADDGRGGDRPRGAGLRGVAERLAAIGGRLETSGAVESFRLRAVVPVPTPVQQVGAP